MKLTDLSVLLSIFIEYFVPDTVLEKHYPKIPERLKEYTVSGVTRPVRNKFEVYQILMWQTHLLFTGPPCAPEFFPGPLQVC